jgi:drug/metabolite transporter (DMT)-like permease
MVGRRLPSVSSVLDRPDVEAHPNELRSIEDEDSSVRAMNRHEASLLRPAAWMITAAFAFATMGALTHTVGPRCDWLVIAWIRIASTFVCSAAMAKAAGVPLVFWEPRTLWIRSIAGTFSLLCSFFSLTRLPVADVLTLSNTYPLWIVLLAWLQVRRPTAWLDLACVVSGMAGVALIQRPYLSGKGDIAVVVALLGSFATAVAMLGLHRLKNVDARAVVAHFSGLATATIALYLILRGGHPIPAFDRVSTVAMLAGVGLSGTVGQVFLTRAYASGPPERIAVLGLTQVVFAMGYDFLLEGRGLTAESLAGVLLVLAPTAWVTSQAGARTKAKAPRPARSGRTA